jgi:hypothetical protein
MDLSNADEKKTHYKKNIIANIDHYNRTNNCNITWSQFINDFQSNLIELDTNDFKKCMCETAIYYNFEYTNGEHKFILGRCCIKTYSNKFKALYVCTDCKVTMRNKHDTNKCKACRVISKKSPNICSRCEIKYPRKHDSGQCKACRIYCHKCNITVLSGSNLKNKNLCNDCTRTRKCCYDKCNIEINKNNKTNYRYCFGHNVHLKFLNEVNKPNT